MSHLFTLALNECVLSHENGRCLRQSPLHKMTASHRAVKEIQAYKRWTKKENEEKLARLTFGQWLFFHWTHFRAWLHRCPECRQRGYLGIGPRWEDDSVAKMLGVATFGCPTCGKGAVEERDAQREAQR